MVLHMCVDKFGYVLVTGTDCQSPLKPVYKSNEIDYIQAKELLLIGCLNKKIINFIKIE